MDIYKLRFTRLQIEIFKLLCIKAGEKLNKRQISKLLKVSPTAIAKSLPLLKKEELIKIITNKGINLTSIELNRDNQKTMLFKRVENLRFIYESGLSEFLYDEFSGNTIILFGSYSKGEDVCFGERDDRNSDIDIAIIGTKGKEVDLTKYEKELQREIRINFYPSFKEIHKHLKENIFNGIVIAGGIEL